MRSPAAKRVLGLILVLLVAPLAADAQPMGQVPRVGILSLAPLSSFTLPQQFPQALRDLGYVENQNLVLEWRSADGRSDRLAGLAAELVRLKVNVIVAVTDQDIRDLVINLKTAKHIGLAIPQSILLRADALIE